MPPAKTPAHQTKDPTDLPPRPAGNRPTTTLRWVSGFTQDSPVFEADHRQLFKHTQNAIAALQQDQRAEAGRAVALLSTKARRHFHDEDQLMRESSYPGYYNHSEQHRRLMLGLEQLQMTLAMHHPDPSKVVHYLRSWFTLHLLKDDQALSRFLAPQAN
jgi:hemerythrin-like metal-binding protein